MCVLRNDASQQTRKKERLRLQARREIHAIGEEESDQDPQQITTARVHDAVADMLRRVDQQNKTIERKRVKLHSSICIVS